MALLQINYFSEALMKITTFHIYLPNDLQPMMMEGNAHYKRKTKTLFLLHGFSGNTTDWMTNSMAQQLSLQYNLAIVMPSGENSFYLDGKGTGRAYARFLGEELVSYVSKTFGLSNQKEDLFIGGLSMGGFGAIRTALFYHETFSKAVALSSALIIHNIMGMKPGERDDIADYDYYVSTFGDLTKLSESVNNPEYLIKRNKEENRDIPALYMACGTEDFLIEENRSFHDFLQKEGVPVCYQESPGIHDWNFWNTYLEPAIQWLLL
ncbi:MAG: putative tributyrin esterase [Clostridiales bacterium]|nr:putative tributyrin esterase [Clostridiales bacterium]